MRSSLIWSFLGSGSKSKSGEWELINLSSVHQHHCPKLLSQLEMKRFPSILILEKERKREISRESCIVLQMHRAGSDLAPEWPFWSCFAAICAIEAAKKVFRFPGKFLTFLKVCSLSLSFSECLENLQTASTFSIPSKFHNKVKGILWEIS